MTTETQQAAPRIEWKCEHTTEATTHAEARRYAGEFASRDDEGAYLAGDVCPPCAAARAARSIFYTITYDTPGAVHGTPDAGGWYPSEAKEIRGDSEKLIRAADGEPDYKATAQKLLREWGRSVRPADRRGRARFQGWVKSAQGQPADVQVIVTFRANG